MANIDLDKMLQKVKSSQWLLADIDWDAPGAEMISDEQRPKLTRFMSDLVWIEHVGARGFAAMAKNAPDDTLRQLYTYFHAEEQRHANAELALMRRWGMLEEGDIPVPNNSIRLSIEWLDRYADDLPYHVLGSVIPALEVALDGALCKFLLDEVSDPVCHDVFARINDDESRHLGVGFTVMEMQGHDKTLLDLVEMITPAVDLRVVLGLVVYWPLLNKMRDNVVAMGLPEEKLFGAMKKFEKIGGRTAAGRRNPFFRVISAHMKTVMDRDQLFYHVPVDLMVRLTDRIPRRLLPAVPSWVKELTAEPYA
jgi:hypothetical protein